MPLPRFKKLPEEKRRAILDAAAAEFAENGFEGASFNRIIATAGISKGAMYYYFVDKGDAYGAVLDDVLDRVEALFVGFVLPAAAEDFWRQLAEGSEVIMGEFLDDPQTAALMRTLYQRGPGDATYDQLLTRVKDWIERLLRLGQDLGAVRDDMPRDLLVAATLGTVMAIDKWFDEAMLDMEIEELLSLQPKVLELLRGMIAARA